MPSSASHCVMKQLDKQPRITHVTHAQQQNIVCVCVHQHPCSYQACSHQCEKDINQVCHRICCTSQCQHWSQHCAIPLHTLFASCQ